MTAPNYRNSMLRLGFDEADLDDGGSDRLLDAIVAWGDENAIRDRVQAHLDAGADHVCIQTLPSGEVDLDALRRLAPALLDALAAPERGERNTQPAGKLAQTGGARGRLVGRCDHDAAA